MKHLLLLCLLLFCCQLSYGQNDSIAISEHGSWIIMNSEATQGWDPITENYIWFSEESYIWYYTQGDSLINGSNYKKLYRVPVHFDGVSAFAQTFTASYILAYRNDSSNRAYRILADSTSEELWYDFNLAIGDTLWDCPTFPMGFGQVFNHTDSVEYCDSTYERYYYHYYSQPGEASRDNIIKGIGGTHHFVEFGYNSMAFDTLMVFCEGVNSLAEMDGSVMISRQSDLEPEPLLTVYPNPAQDILNIRFQDPGIQADRVFICDMQGRILMDHLAINAPIEIDHLARGMYFVILLSGPEISHLTFLKE